MTSDVIAWRIRLSINIRLGCATTTKEKLMHRVQRARPWGAVLVLSALLTTRGSSYASDHLDTPTVIADPAADIGDIFAWTAPDGRHLNLVMDIVAHRFSDRLQYVFHVDAGERFGKTTATTLIVCRLDLANAVECWVGETDYVRGDASNPAGLEGKNRRFRVFAGLRDDPFFNNVKGTRAAYNVAGAGLRRGARADGAGCPRYDRTTSHAILDTWRHTDRGPATNFLAGWKSSTLVISIDLAVVNRGGQFLAVWSAVHKPSRMEPSPAKATKGKNPMMPTLGVQIERTARPLIKNGLVGGPLAPDSVSNRRKESYNRVARTGWAQFAANIEETLGLYDGFDGICGNQWLADPKANAIARYQPLAKVLADDRLWINSASTVCTQFLAVELTAFATPGALSGDCGGRTPNYDASNIFRSLLTNGTAVGVDDGLKRDDKVHSTTDFPFLAAP
jgi:hypothetical protein